MRLFFYGVLQRDLAGPAIAAMLEGLGPGVAATARGLLYAVPDPRGFYPVLVPGEGVVHGTVHERGSADLAVLDAFEGIEYRRAPLTATLAGGEEVRAEAYCYQFAPRPDFVALPDGNFARWLQDTRNAPLAG